ncbi:Dual specificity protein phosphatase 10 [Orchesella cincta]|uniref:Dual specificity protein phosphatase 10 n=1 Tax=Orchesella cincta TaxID=48709 RepID=A0A1D2MIC2_ORCCI|nr:Dual specificity protein phosphatase 10 [Orchesella cincta]
MSGPVETELPPQTLAFRRKDKLRLSLHTNRAITNTPTVADPQELKERVRSLSCDELARKLENSNNKQRLPFLLLDCRGYLCYTECHIAGAVHIPCADRFNRKRVQNCASVLDLVSTNNRRNKTGSSPNGSSPSSSSSGGGVSAAKWRDVIVYDEGTSDLTLDSAGLQSPISFVLMHLLQENRQPIFLNGSITVTAHVVGDLMTGPARGSFLLELHSQQPILYSPPPLLTPMRNALAHLLKRGEVNEHIRCMTVYKFSELGKQLKGIGRGKKNFSHVVSGKLVGEGRTVQRILGSLETKQTL